MECRIHLINHWYQNHFLRCLYINIKKMSHERLNKYTNKIILIDKCLTLMIIDRLTIK